MFKFSKKQNYDNPQEAQYAMASLRAAELEYLKALDAVDYASAMADYHKKRIERYKAYEANSQAKTNPDPSGITNYVPIASVTTTTERSDSVRPTLTKVPS